VEPMLGQLKYSGGGWGKPEWGRLYGLPVLRTCADPTGRLGELRLHRAGHTLRRGGAVRTLVPVGFERWDLLERWDLKLVDPLPLLRRQGGELALELLRRQGIPLERTAVSLLGQRADGDMERAAILLSRYVRHVVISAPNGGEELARLLHRRFGIPVLPEEEGAQVSLCFAPARPQADAVLRIYGPSPQLAGLKITAPALEREDRGDLSLLTALWESGKLSKSDLKIT